MKRLILVALVVLCGIGGILFSTHRAAATITNFISFQGKLTNPDGTNVTDGNYSIRFRIYNDPTADAANSCAANSCKWEETQATVAVSAGLFQVNLGTGTTLPGSVDFNTNALYLGIKVGADAEMTPRVRLTAAPQAFNSDLLDGLDSTNFVQLAGGNINIGSGTVTSGAVNGLTLTQAADGFTLAGGTTSRTLTVTGANITVGSTIQPTAAGSLIIQSNGANALTLTSGAAATWSTTAGLLTVQGFGGVTVNTPTATGATGAVTIQTGNSTAGSAGNVTIDTGTTSTGTPTINIAAANAKAVQIGNNTSNPAVTINSGTGTISLGTGAQGRTVNLATGLAAQLVTVGSASGASSLDLQAGTGGIDITTQGTGQLNVGANAVAQTVNVGNATGATAVTLQSGTGNLNIMTQGTGSLNIGNNAVAQTINVGNGTGATTVAVLCGTGTCGFGDNAIAHATILGSNTGTASTTLQAGTGGINLTSGANITVGTIDAVATLLVLDSKNTTGDPTGVNGAMYYNSADDDFRAYQNSRWTNIQPVRYAYLSADRTNSTTTYADVTDLGFAVDANRNYELVCNIIYQTAATTTGIGIALNGPASPGVVAGQFVSNSSATALNGRSFNAYNGTGKTTGVSAANANTYGMFRAYFRNGATAGTLQLRFASEIAASNAVVKANSYCRLSEL